MKSETGVRTFTRGQRLKAWLIGWTGYLGIAIIGHTMRWKSEGAEHVTSIHDCGRQAVFAFWHGRIFPAVFHFRRQGIVVMTSMNADGEAIAQCIERFGFGAARGSSSRGGLRALAEMGRAIRQKRDAGFTVDGPRGPRYIAKPGPILLAYKTGAAVACFHIAIKRTIQLSSWDEFQIPLPFTPAVVLHAPPIWVPANSTEEELRRLQSQMQSVLDGLKAQGDALW